MGQINYKEEGTGRTVILIHGFPMNQQVWKGFSERLSNSFQVVTVDLPGFGKSAALNPGFSLDTVASTLRAWVSERQYSAPVIVGHSLGGYVALAMAAQEPALMAGICLFHSTAHADSEEKKQSREKVLRFIEEQGVEAFTSNFIAQLYADPQHGSVTLVKNIAVQSSKESVTGYTKAMRDRPDRTGLLKTFPKPVFFLAGEKDQGIPTAAIRAQAELNPRFEALILPDVAHMGMFEAETVCVNAIQKFVEKC